MFPFDEAMAAYLRATGRSQVADLAEQHADQLRADPEVENDPEKYYDRVIRIDLDTLEPHINGPHAPDRAHPISAFAKVAQEQGWPPRFSSALIGSCTNSSYEDMVRAVAVARDALAHGLRLTIPMFVTPGSDQIRGTIVRDGLREPRGL